MAGDGQVTLGTTVMKQTAAKIRRLKGGDVIAGFAGSSADAFALFSRFEMKLEEHRGNLERSAIELAKDWRTDKMLRQLEALLIVADKTTSLLISGTGDLIVNNNHFSNNHPGIATGGGGLTLTSDGAGGNTTMSVTNNTFRDSVGNALTIVKTTGTSTQTGTFSGNTIGVTGVPNSGSAEGDALKLQTVGGGTDTSATMAATTSSSRPSLPAT